MTLSAGDRIRFNELTQPQYLRGCTGTIVRKQPGEHRYLIDVDNDPRARRFAGGQWCVGTFALEVMSQEPLDSIDKRAKEAAETWMSKIAPAIEKASVEWANEKLDTAEQHEAYFALHHPALLWRFYYHLASMLTGAAAGWETVYHQEKERNG